MGHLSADVRFAVRSLLKRPLASLLLVATLAVGLAANAVVFDMLDALVLRAFDFPNRDRLVRLWETSPDFDGIDRSNVAPANFLDWREQGAGAFEALVGLEWWEPNLRGREAAERVQGYRVSPGFFAALGVSPAIGRGFTEDEAVPGRNRVVVLGHAAWHRVYGGQPDMVGESIVIDGEPHLVVGIAPPGFWFPEGAEAWAPLALPSPGEARRDQHYLSAMGVLATGRTRAQASAAMAVVSQRLAAEHPATNGERGLEVGDFTLGFGDPVLPSILVIWQVGAILVLLIACVNVANLVLARGAERRREMALRLALGARRGRIVWQLLTEGLVPAFLAVGLAMPLVALAARALRDNMPAEIVRFLPGWAHLGLDARTFAFGALLAVLATAVFTVVPAIRGARTEPNEGLRDGGRGFTGGGGRQHGRNALVVAQLASALVLVGTAGLAVKSADGYLNGPQGFDPEGLLVFETSLSESRYADLQKRRDFVRDVEARLLELPGVESVAATSALPAHGSFSTRAIEVEGQPLAKDARPPEVDARWVSDGYFDTLRLPLFRGRGFGVADDEDATPVAVISRNMAERFWPGQDAIGRRFRLAATQGSEPGPWVGVVGVSGDVIHHWVMRRNVATFYRPLRQEPQRGLAFALRSSGPPEALAASVRRALVGIDPDQPADGVTSMQRAISRATIGMQYVAAVMAAFGGIALVLAISGVYGVMSYRVSLRRAEIGVRVALGASRFDVLRLTLGQALWLSTLGLGVGAILAVAASRVLASTLRGGVVFEPSVLAGLTVVLATAALLAAWVPARRALAIDPVESLRAE